MPTGQVTNVRSTRIINWERRMCEYENTVVYMIVDRQSCAKSFPLLLCVVVFKCCCGHMFLQHKRMRKIESVCAPLFRSYGFEDDFAECAAGRATTSKKLVRQKSRN